MPKTGKKSAAKSPGKGDGVKEGDEGVSRVARGSYTMPSDEYKTIERVRRLCLKREIVITQSEVLRASVALLNRLPDKEVVKVVQSLPKVKPGKPPVD